MANAQATGCKTPDIAREVPDLGNELISPQRYHSTHWLQQEWNYLWKTVWNLGIRESAIPEPGDYIRHSLGKEDFVFIRTDDGSIRGFYNVCRHRGNRIIQGEDEGRISQFHCPYHGWSWHLDGRLAAVTAPEFFPLFRAQGVPEEELGLYPVKVEQWGGWVWFNLNPECAGLQDYLGKIQEFVSPYQMERWSVVDYKTLHWHCNWKHALDAFSESYHFEALHPQLLQWARGHDVPIDLIGLHSRMANYVGTVSPQVENRTDLSPALQEAMRSYLGIPVDPDQYGGNAEDVYLTVRQLKRAAQHSSHLPYADLTDEQLSEICHYGIFPNVIWALTPEGMVMFRPRPHPLDPGQCFFDLILIAHLPPGSEEPEFEHQILSHKESRDLSAMMNIHPINAEVVQQDAANLQPMQQGTASDIFEGSLLCDQEIRLRHFHQTLDRLLNQGGWQP